MSKKLKTLKDITIPDISIGKNRKLITNPKYTDVDLLKEEAKKWIEELEDIADRKDDRWINCEYGVYDDSYDIYEVENLIKWIKHFFDI